MNLRLIVATSALTHTHSTSVSVIHHRHADNSNQQITYTYDSSSVAEWLALWTQVQKAWVQIGVAMLSGNSLRQTVHTNRACVHQAAKLVAALLMVVRVTAGLAEK